MTNHVLKVVIIALKKNVAFHDDLIKRLSGITLIQRVISKALELDIGKSDIHVMTDSEEVRVIGERNKINIYCDPELIIKDFKGPGKSTNFLKSLADQSDFILFLSPYSPLISKITLKNALSELIKSNKHVLKPIKLIKRIAYDGKDKTTLNYLFENEEKPFKVESKAFSIIKSKSFESINNEISCLSFPISNDFFTIESYQDWWVCEKFLERKRIIFRVIGNNKVGMGHIGRSLSIAHEISNHEVLFVCDTQSREAAIEIENRGYLLKAYDQDRIISAIINLNPDLLINDILSTTKEDVAPFKDLGIKTINFEDLGEGARLSDITINELYDEPIYTSKNTFWGHDYFFLRDEFNEATPNKFKKKIEKILISFGGTDQHNLSLIVYNIIKDFCNLHNILIHIVCGSGYSKYDDLVKQVNSDPRVLLTRATGVISTIMEESQLAIVSNGRTVYELAHLNIPSIIISQHNREKGHTFASLDTGFEELGVYKKGHTEELIKKTIENLFLNIKHRKKLFRSMMTYNFANNKKNVLKMIFSILDS